jgi:microcystin-dependent protein
VGGTPNVTLLESEIPSHNDSLMVSGRDANENDAQNLYWARASISAYTSSNQNPVTMSPQITAPTGGSQPHNNMQPYLTVNFCIALQGVFPSRG